MPFNISAEKFNFSALISVLQSRIFQPLFQKVVLFDSVIFGREKEAVSSFENYRKSKRFHNGNFSELVSKVIFFRTFLI